MSQSHAVVINTPEGIAFARLAALKGGVRLESIGLKRRGMSAKSIACRDLGLSVRTPHTEVIKAIQSKMDEMLAGREAVAA
jgi:hypothetical protein